MQAPQILDVRNELPRNPNPNRRYKQRHINEINGLVIHSTNGNGDLFPLARYFTTPSNSNHISKLGAPQFCYHYWIDYNSAVYYCTSHNKISWHAGNHNPSTVGIALRYRYTNNKQPPPSQQLYGAYAICVKLCLTLPNIDPTKISGHRELLGTGYKIENGKKIYRKPCPGWQIDMNQFRYNVMILLQESLNEIGLYKGEIDGIWGRKSRRALRKFKKGLRHGTGRRTRS